MYQWEWSEEIWLYILWKQSQENFLIDCVKKYKRKKGISIKNMIPYFFLSQKNDDTTIRDGEVNDASFMMLGL